MSLQSPLRTFHSSLRNSFTSRAPRHSLRYASLNSAIGRGIRRSQGQEDSRSSSNENRDDVERSSFRRDSRRSGRDDYTSQGPPDEGDNFVRRGSFRGLPQEYQRPDKQRRFRDSNGPPVASREFPRTYDKAGDSRGDRRVGYTGKEGQGRQRPPRVEFDEDEFIRTGNFSAIPTEYHGFKGAEPRNNKESRPAVSGLQGVRKPRHNLDSDAVTRDRLDEAAPSQNNPAYEFEREKKLSRRKKGRLHRPTETNPERVKERVKPPKEIPYTTPASEFIYGTAAVEAALRCSQRQLYRLYVYQGASEENLSEAKLTVRKLALSKNIRVKMAFAEWDRLLDKMSAGRPHNGCVLEASPLPRTPVKALKPVQLEDGHFRLELAPQTREEAEVNGANDRIAINAPIAQEHKRYPVLLLLDGVVDPGNLGAIIRSAYYLGADAVVFAGRNSAPLSPVTIKASAGSAENMPLLDVRNEVDFIQRSKANGWRFYAADAPSPGVTYFDSASLHAPSSTPAGSDSESEFGAPISNAPSVIMMGNEGSGLSHHIKSHADSVVSIPGARGLSDPARVDSLNVSVAAALLMETFLRNPLGISPVPRKKSSR